MLQDHIAPVAKKLGMPHIGFHTFRHSYRAWLGGLRADGGRVNVYKCSKVRHVKNVRQCSRVEFGVSLVHE
jgi:integrase